MCTENIWYVLIQAVRDFLGMFNVVSVKIKDLLFCKYQQAHRKRSGRIDMMSPNTTQNIIKPADAKNNMTNF